MKNSKNFFLDIDECINETDNCDPSASCTNSIGSFTCACPAGFNGDGVTCAGNFINTSITLEGFLKLSLFTP